MYTKVSYPERGCSYCGKLFKPNRKDKKYCKDTCQKHASKRRSSDFKEKRNKYAARYKRPYREFLKDYCECCGFVATHRCQLDVDHIDGNHSNNAPENLQTLCANCHRLKTWLNRDWESK